MAWSSWDIAVSALCAWREARGEGREGMRAVLHVIRNRSRQKNISIAQVTTAPMQFSSMTAPEDPELTRFPRPGGSDGAAFETAMQIAEDVATGADVQDPTSGATFYFNPRVVMPAWAQHMTKTATIGNHDFYKE